MGPSRRSHQHGPPLLGRVQVSPCSPTSSRVCSPPTPCPHQPRLRCPLPVAYLDAGACSVPMGADDTCARHVPCVGDGSPALRSTGVSSRRGEGLPGYGAILFVRAMVEHPAGYVPLLAHVAQRTLWPSGKSAPWASGKITGVWRILCMAQIEHKRTSAYAMVANRTRTQERISSCSSSLYTMRPSSWSLSVAYTSAFPSHNGSMSSVWPMR
jgi:hypothetical protein